MVYFIQQGEDGPIKIGVSETPKQRLKSLQTGSPHRLHLRDAAPVPEDQRLESALHNELASENVGGEWFDLAEWWADGYVATMHLLYSVDRELWRAKCHFCPGENKNPVQIDAKGDDFPFPEEDLKCQYQCLNCGARGPLRSTRRLALYGWNELMGGM